MKKNSFVVTNTFLFYKILRFVQVFFSKPALLKIDVKGVRSVCLLVMIRVAIAHIHSICMYMKNVTNRLFIEDAKKCKRSKTSFE